MSEDERTSDGAHKPSPFANYYLRDATPRITTDTNPDRGDARYWMLYFGEFLVATTYTYEHVEVWRGALGIDVTADHEVVIRRSDFINGKWAYRCTCGRDSGYRFATEEHARDAAGRHSLPTGSPIHTVYQHVATDGRILYVGVTRQMNTRQAAHASQSPWWPEVHEVVEAMRAGKALAYAREAQMIRTLRPPYNRTHAGAKGSSPLSTYAPQ